MAKELTLVFFKPDAMQMMFKGNKMIYDQIIERFNAEKIEIVSFKFFVMTDKQYDEHYGHVKHLDFYEDMRKFITSERLLFTILMGENAIQRVRDMIGPTRGAPAGTIRGDYGSDGFKNLIHASDSYESANKEIARFFYTLSIDS